MTGIWLSADATLRHVLAHELVLDVATSKLEGRIRRGEFPARAAHLSLSGAISSDAVIPSYFWTGQREIGIDFTNNTARSRTYSLALKPATDGGGGYVPGYLSEDTATGVAFSARHVYAIWPDIETKASATSLSPNRRSIIEAAEAQFGSIEASGLIPTGMRDEKIIAWLKSNNRAPVSSKTIGRTLGTKKAK